MKSQTLWTKLTELVTSSLSDLDQSDLDAVLERWGEQKSAVLALVPTSERRKKDKNAPTRPLTAYICFCTKNRPRVKEENKDANGKELITLLAGEWKKLTDKEKKPYVTMASKDKKRYEKEMASYVPPQETGAPEEKKTRKRKEKDPNQPKRAISAYLFFSQEKRPEVKEEFPNLANKEVFSKLGAMWKALSEKDRAPYDEMARKDKERYNREKGVKPKEKPVKEEKKNTTKRNPPVKQTEGWKRFYEEQKEVHDDWTERKLKMTVNKQWREMTEEDREQYEHPEVDDAEEDMELSDEELEDELATE